MIAFSSVSLIQVMQCKDELSFTFRQCVVFNLLFINVAHVLTAFVTDKRFVIGSYNDSSLEKKKSC